MKKFTANHTFTNHNFVVQNLRGERIANEYLPAICILKNVLQRGTPTLLSDYLQKEIGSIHNEPDFRNAYPLIDSERPKWERIIRGDDKKNYYPAKKFFDELIIKHLKGYEFIQSLIVPEVPINEITQVEVEKFVNEQVDFYLPQAYLIIEIDGMHHDPVADKIRDEHTANYLIETVRIRTSDLEAENDDFFGALDKIKKRIDRVAIAQKKRKERGEQFISLEEYRIAFQKGINVASPYYRATAIMRFQLLVLEMLENGILKFENDWNIEILTHDVQGFARLALSDLFLWFEHIFKLQKVKFIQPKVRIRDIENTEDFSVSNDVICLDFSILKRYTDEFQAQSHIVFVRTDYFDEYLYFKKGDAIGKLKFISYKPYDYFCISTAEMLTYRLEFGGDDSDEQALLFFLWNIFLQNNKNLEYKTLKFREGQIPIIANALSRNHTIGLLPTGSGKSVCYQLSAMLQPAISFVVCPIKALMYDQKADLDRAYFNRINHITSDDDGEDKDKILDDFGGGKYFFIFISPERFQSKVFRQYMSKVNQAYDIAYAVIDEAHCVSEWGHDFRTSYLNLANAIRRYCPNSRFLGLTATASLNVLKDIQIEFGVEQDNVKTPVDYSRSELEFVVIDDKNNKYSELKALFAKLEKQQNVLKLKGDDTRCGIVFTMTVNGGKGCYSIAQALSKDFGSDIRFFSGSKPDLLKVGDKEFNDFKKGVQNDFKQNKFPVLVATKAFGMGMNKPNIHYTIHYGIPGSMEALYQEAGRAGRDKEKFRKQKALCCVLMTKNTNTEVYDEVFNRDTAFSKLEKLKKGINGDINTNLYFFSLGVDLITKELGVIRKVFDKYAVSGAKKVEIHGAAIFCTKAKTEKAIYRLSQLGIVKDWTISDFFGGGVFEVDFAVYDEQSIEKALFGFINKYDPGFTYERIFKDAKYRIYNKILNAPKGYTQLDKFIFILLQWSYDNFAYNRRQSLKNIYENCCKYADNEWDKERFKKELESYFKFNEASFILQHIAEHPMDYNKWFDVFYQLNADNEITTTLITKQQRESLSGNLSRFLESYRYNAGLDFISGMLRLFFSDYDNADGRARMESSLDQVMSLPEDDVKQVLYGILKIASRLTDTNKGLLAETLCKYYDTEEYLRLIATSLGDAYTLAVYIGLINKRLEIVNNRVYGKFSKVRRSGK